MLVPAVSVADRLKRGRALRSPAQQAEVERAARALVLYTHAGCAFCFRARRALKRLQVPVEVRDVARVERYRRELIQGGGRCQVPCLKIQDRSGAERWLYESADIVDYLEQRFR